MTFYAASYSTLAESERFRDFSEFLRYHWRHGRAELDGSVVWLFSPVPPDEARRQSASFGGVPRGVHTRRDYRTGGIFSLIPLEIWRAAGLQDPPPKKKAPWQESLQESEVPRSPGDLLRHYLRRGSYDLHPLLRQHRITLEIPKETVVRELLRAGFTHARGGTFYTAPVEDPYDDYLRYHPVQVSSRPQGSSLLVGSAVWNYYGLPPM